MSLVKNDKFEQINIKLIAVVKNSILIKNDLHLAYFYGKREAGLELYEQKYDSEGSFYIYIYFS